MNGHDEYLELVAASIDFGLTEEEVARLNYHLASCPECRRAATELRGQAAAIATTPIAPLAPARSELILRAALRKPAARPRWGMLAVAALLATLGGGVLFAGFQMITDDDPAPDQSPPIVAEVSAPPSDVPAEESADPGGGQAPDDGPPVTPNPGDEESPPPADPAKLAFPLPYTANLEPVRVAPALNDRLWVSVGRGRETVLALLDANGRPLPNWPISLPSTENCYPLAASDGSVRILCEYSEEDPESCTDVCSEERVYAWDANGEGVVGFPVSLPGGLSLSVRPDAARIVGNEVALVITDSPDELVAEFGEFGSARTLRVAADGSLHEGTPLPASGKCCTIGPDGTAYGTTVSGGDDGPTTTDLIAFEANGMRPGWPVVLPGDVSAPSFGPGGMLVFSSWIEGGSSRIFQLNPDGIEAHPPMDINRSIEWAPDMDGPLPPLVDERGQVWVTAEEAIVGFDANGARIPGRYEPETGFIVYDSECAQGDTGCQSWMEPPVLAPRGLVYSLETAGADKGGRITVLNPDGGIRSGWPVILQRDGARFESVTIGENRVAYAVAREPEPGDRFSLSILAIAPNSTVTWVRPIVEP